MTHNSIGGQIASPSFQASPIFTLFGVCIIHGSARPAKAGKGLGAFIRSMMSGGHKLDASGGGGGGATPKTTHWIVYSSALLQF